jgi:hypothetical protein
MDAEEEVDPLDAFMSENDAKASVQIQQAQEKAKAVEGEEVDPLDAFMAAEVLPAVNQNGAQSTPAASLVGPQIALLHLLRLGTVLLSLHSTVWMSRVYVLAEHGQAGLGWNALTWIMSLLAPCSQCCVLL